METCHNCDYKYSEAYKFCPNCGQKSDTHRINTHFLMHEVIHAFTHADAGIFYLIKELALRPGIVIKEYIAGQRKKYYNPFNFFLITVAISAFLSSYFHLFDIDLKSPNPISQMTAKRVNLIFVASVPIQAFFTWVFFRKKKYNFAENIVYHCFLGGFRFIFFLLIFTVFINLFRSQYYVVLYSYLFLFLIYAIWAAKQFFEENIWLTILKVTLSFILNQIIITAVITFIYFAFIRNNH